MSYYRYFIFIGLILFIGFFLFLDKSEDVSAVILANKMYFVEKADTNTERQRGLSMRAPIPPDRGMLFVFDSENKYGIWMKDMMFSLDIIWIDSNFKIVHFEQNVSPETYPKVFFPPSKNLYVLEILAGQINSLNIKIGDSVKFVKK